MHKNSSLGSIVPFWSFSIHLIMTEARSKRRVLLLIFIVKRFNNQRMFVAKMLAN